MINEVEMNPAGANAGAKWVELCNASSEKVSLSGWQLSISIGCATAENTC